jgi:hypothetical protein
MLNREGPYQVLHIDDSSAIDVPRKLPQIYDSTTDSYTITVTMLLTKDPDYPAINLANKAL